MFKPVLQTEVSTIINSLKNNAAGWDDLAPKQTKTVTKFISKPLTHLCNISMKKGFFLCEFKVANILFKSGNAMCVNNYKLISILPVFSKVYEKIMFNCSTERERLSLSAFLETEDIGIHIVHMPLLIITYTLEWLFSLT